MRKGRSSSSTARVMRYIVNNSSLFSTRKIAFTTQSTAIGVAQRRDSANQHFSFPFQSNKRNCTEGITIILDNLVSKKEKVKSRNNRQDRKLRSSSPFFGNAPISIGRRLNRRLLSLYPTSSFQITIFQHIGRFPGSISVSVSNSLGFVLSFVFALSHSVPFPR